MTTIRSSGFQDRGAVTLATSKDGVAKGPVSISAWRQPAAGEPDFGTMSISMFRMDGTAQDTATGDFSSPAVCSAPEAIRFRAEVLSATGLRTLTNGFDGDGNVLADALYSYTHPDGVFSYDQQMHELEFVWNFGGTSGIFDAVSRLPTFMRQKAASHGKFTEHVFETAGTHDVTCEVWRVDYSGGTQTSVLVARKTIQVTVAGTFSYLTDPSHVICINPDFPAGYTADANTLDASAPVGSSGYPDVDTLRALQQSTIGFGIRTILFRRGKTHFFNENWLVGDYLTMMAYGPEADAKPILEAGPDNIFEGSVYFIGNQGFGSARKYYRFVDLDARGLWDSATETGFSLTFCRPFQATNIVFINCNFTDFGQVVQMGNESLTDGDQSLVLYNTDIHGWQDYGIRGGSVGLWVGVRGSVVAQQENAAGNSRGWKDENNPKNWHGPMRFGYIKSCHVEASDVYSRSSWSGAAQPCIRIGTNNEWNETTQEDENTAYFDFICHGNIFEGGSTAVSMSTENGDNRLKPANCLMKHNINLFDFNSESMFNVARGATSLIENILVAPAIARGRWNNDLLEYKERNRRTFAIDGSGQSRIDSTTGLPIPFVPENRQMPIRQIGNTIIDYKSPYREDDALGFIDFSNFTGLVEIRDNVLWGPEYDVPLTSDGPMETAITIASYNTVAPFFFDTNLQEYVSFTTGVDSGLPHTTPGGAVTVLRPQTGAGVDGAATGAMSRKDVLGTMRPAAASAGALEAP